MAAGQQLPRRDLVVNGLADIELAAVTLANQSDGVAELFVSLFRIEPSAVLS